MELFGPKTSKDPVNTIPAWQGQLLTLALTTWNWSWRRCANEQLVIDLFELTSWCQQFKGDERVHCWNLKRSSTSRCLNCQKPAQMCMCVLTCVCFSVRCLWRFPSNWCILNQKQVTTCTPSDFSSSAMTESQQTVKVTWTSCAVFLIMSESPWMQHQHQSVTHILWLWVRFPCRVLFDSVFLFVFLVFWSYASWVFGSFLCFTPVPEVGFPQLSDTHVSG